MSPEALHDALMALPGATFDVKWGGDRVYSVGGKMFVIAGEVGDPAPACAFKASDIAFEVLVEQGLARPAAYIGRYKWVKLAAPDALCDEDLLAHLREAHRIVAQGLPKKVRASLGLA